MPAYIGSGALDDLGILSAENVVFRSGRQWLAKLGGASQFRSIPASEVSSVSLAAACCGRSGAL
jgi:hypothetical protein